MPQDVKMTKGWIVPVSTMAQNTFNPIRDIVDTMKLEPNPDKAMIALSIGDPTIFGNLPVLETCDEAVIECVKERKHNGYVPSMGFLESRQAVAKYISVPNGTVEAKDIVLTSGCSHALELCISCLANPGQNILIPRPAFSLYKTLADSLSIHVKQYDLLPERSWEADIDHMESLVDDKTAAIIVCNPSNPCGSVYSATHIKEIIGMAERNMIPIIADEIYERFVFSGNEFHPMASLSTNVPILACGGLTKRFLVPGWRMGWIVVHDRNGAFSQVRTGLLKLTQRILGPNTLVQAALPKILNESPASFFSETLEYIEKNANLFFERLTNVEGLNPVMPQGAMYMMVRIDVEAFPGINSDVDFTQRLVTEQSVFCLPGKCFQCPNFFRIVLTVPFEKVKEACERIQEFCQQHYQPLSKPVKSLEAKNNCMNSHHTVIVNGHSNGQANGNGHTNGQGNGHTH